MNCDRIKRQLPAHAAGFLRPRATRRVAAHLASCPHCRRDLEALRRVGKLASALGVQTPPRDLWPQVRARIMARPTPGLAWQTALRPAATLAAALALLVGTSFLFQPHRPPSAPVTAADGEVSVYLSQHSLAAWRTALADPALLGTKIASTHAQELPQ